MGLKSSIFVILSVVCSAVLNIYLIRLIEDKCDVLKNNKVSSKYIYLCLISIAISLSVCFGKINYFSYIDVALISGYITFMIAISIIDYKTKTIPNEVLKVSIAYWIILSLCYALFGRSIQAVTRRVVFPIVVGIVAFLMFYFVYAITKHSLGAGDVKMAFIMGIYLGDYITTTLLIGSIICACYSLIGIIFRKKDKSEEIPFSPFMLLGSIIALILPT